MTRVSSLLLALLLAVTPTVDVACRAICTPPATATAAASCHEVAPATADGALLPAVSCRPDAATAVVPVDVTRLLLAPAPLLTTHAAASAHLRASASADLRQPVVRPRPPQACPSTIVLRI